MSEYVIMPSNDYKSACDAIRNISKKTDLIKSGDMVNEISEITNKIEKLEFKQMTLPDNTYYLWSHIAYGNGKFVVATPSKTNLIAYSTDGINWTNIDQGYKDYIYKLKYLNDRFIAQLSSTKYYKYSIDGINWIGSSFPSSNVLDFAYGNGKFVTVAGNTNAISYYSDDGINWSESKLPTLSSSGNWVSVAYGNDKFVAISGAYDTSSSYVSNIAAYSEDGINWTQTTLPVSGQWTIVYGNGKFVAISKGISNTNVLYSEDGINWSKSTLPVSGKWGVLGYGNGKFVAACGNASAYSIDGINWNKINSLPNDNHRNIAFGSEKFVIVSNGVEAYYCDCAVNIS